MAEETIKQIQIIKIELSYSRAEFFKQCCRYEDEIMKLLECGFFNYDTGRIIVDKSKGKIREIDKPERHKWAK